MPGEKIGTGTVHAPTEDAIHSPAVRARNPSPRAVGEPGWGKPATEPGSKIGFLTAWDQWLFLKFDRKGIF